MRDRSPHHRPGRVSVAGPQPSKAGKSDLEPGVLTHHRTLTVDDRAHEPADHRSVLELVAAGTDRDVKACALGAVVDRRPVISHVVHACDADRPTRHTEPWQPSRRTRDLRLEYALRRVG